MQDEQQQGKRLFKIAARRCDVLVGVEGSEARCTNTAYWLFMVFSTPAALCVDCMKAMAVMNSDCAEAFADALNGL